MRIILYLILFVAGYILGRSIEGEHLLDTIDRISKEE